MYNAMAYEAEDDDLDVEIYEELITYSKTFEEHAWKVCTVFLILQSAKFSMGCLIFFKLQQEKKYL